MGIIILIQSAIIIYMFVDGLKCTYKISYYQQRMINNGLKDTVKGMTLMQMIKS